MIDEAPEAEPPEAAAPVLPEEAAAPEEAPEIARSGSVGDADPVSARTGTTYVVERGDTLWSVAAARLGHDPAPAKVAAEVERLWSLNAEAINTGSPDLILVGQVLRLR